MADDPRLLVPICSEGLENPRENPHTHECRSREVFLVKAGLVTRLLLLLLILGDLLVPGVKPAGNRRVGYRSSSLFRVTSCAAGHSVGQRD
jgi:hypothetical protein